MIKLYRHSLSGNSHRVELFLNLLKLDFELINVDLLSGEQKQPEFLAKNPFGQVPVLEDDGVIINESNAILVYLVKKYGNEKWIQTDPVQAAEVQRWLSITASLIAEGPAAARLVTIFNAPYNLADRQRRSHQFFFTLEKILLERSYLAGDQITIADVAAYAYIAHAPEGGVSLQAYPAIRKWLSRIEEQDGFVGMQKTEVSLAA